MSTSTELASEIASAEARLSDLNGELRQATGLQKSSVLTQLSQVVLDLNGLVHEQHALGWGSES